MNRRGDGEIEAVVYIFIFIAWVGSMCIGAFSKPDGAVRALNTQGYKNVQIFDHAWFAVGLRGCGHGDISMFSASAENPRGDKVNVQVCSGVFKGYTVRTD